MYGEDNSLNEEMGEAAKFFLMRSGPTVAVERVSNGFIIRMRKLKQVRVPSPADMDPAQDPMMPRNPLYEQASYEEKVVCKNLEEVIAFIREHFKDLGVDDDPSNV